MPLPYADELVTFTIMWFPAGVQEPPIDTDLADVIRAVYLEHYDLDAGSPIVREAVAGIAA